MNTQIALNNNLLVAFLQKPPHDFTRDDIVRFVVENNVKMINFMYPAEDGRLKTLNFVINDLEYLHTILTLGERVDGSSLFPRFVKPGNSDLYVVPRYSTAFVDPFCEIPTLAMLCSYFDKDGNRWEASPEYTLEKACVELKNSTGLDFHAMGELEYYVISDDNGLFHVEDQRGYHESGPFTKFNEFRAKCMQYIAQAGGRIKYGHNEVGNFTMDGKIFEQNEIEFLPVPAQQAADQLVIAKWIIRNLGGQMGFDVTFAPKITVGKAGSGLHIHMRLMRNGKNAMLSEGKLSKEARRAIAGLMVLAPSITAVGNTNPTSYFRLVPHQEAPTAVCWGDRNRSVLVRVPLGWNAEKDMSNQINPPSEREHCVDPSIKQTVEIRSADCSADVYRLIAALAVALRHGLEREDADAIADRTYVDVNIHAKDAANRLAMLESLPTDCSESAQAMARQRSVYEEKGVFSPDMIDGIISALEAYDPKEVHEAMNSPEKMLSLVTRHFYCG
ncbi:MAG: glutamine synthetase [Muribaculaceae bacterium]|nr:glutamine synthetase [Muribaculaceae bacterium]